MIGRRGLPSPRRRLIRLAVGLGLVVGVLGMFSVGSSLSALNLGLEAADADMAASDAAEAAEDAKIAAEAGQRSASDAKRAVEAVEAETLARDFVVCDSTNETRRAIRDFIEDLLADSNDPAQAAMIRRQVLVRFPPIECPPDPGP